MIAAIIALLGASVFVLVKRNTAANTTSSLVAVTKSTESNPSSEVKIAREITVIATEYKFTPSEIKVKKGETVKIILKNNGVMPHNLIIEKMEGASIDTISINQSGSIVMTPSQTGTFNTFCSIGNHRKMGMVGKLIVE